MGTAGTADMVADTVGPAAGPAGVAGPAAGVAGPAVPVDLAGLAGFTAFFHAGGKSCQ